MAGNRGARRFLVLLGLSALFCGCAAFAPLTLAQTASQAVSATDDRGKKVTLSRPARRIVTLAPHLTELVFASGAGRQLVGVARFSDFPPAARDIPQIGDSALMEFERIVALKPDLILAWKSGNAPADVERLESLGYPVFVSESARLGDVPRVLRSIGTLAGTLPEASSAAADFEKEIRALRERFAKAPRVRVFYMIWRKPLMTVNGAHLISDAITLCGGENVFAGIRQLTPPVTLEAVIAAKPRAVLGGSDPVGGGTFVAEWRAFAPVPLRDLPAFYINPDLIQRPTQRIVDGARAICSALEQVRSGRGNPEKAGKVN